MFAPKILFGSTKETRAAWSKVSRKLIAVSDAVDILESLELIEIVPEMDEFVIYELAPGWSTRRAIWHFNWVHSRWLFPFDNGHKAWKSQFNVVMSGLRLEWYSLGMLFNSLTDLFFMRPESIRSTEDGAKMSDQEIHTNITAPFLDGLLMRIDKLNEYSSRFRYAYPCSDLTRIDGVSWMRGILRIAHIYGICDLSAITRCESMPYEEIIEHLKANCSLLSRRYGYALPAIATAPNNDV